MFYNIILNVLKKYHRHIAANIAVAFAIMAPMIMASAGLAVDMAQTHYVRERACGALDTATISGAATFTKAADIENRIIEVFNSNYPESKIGKTSNITVSVSEDKVEATVDAQYNTAFMHIVGVDKMDMTCRTVIRRDVRGLEVALVLDVTGSMSGSNISSLRTASKNFINIIYDRASDDEFVRIGLVPYGVAVNVGEIAPEIVNYNYPQYRGADVPYVYLDDDNDLTDNVEWHGCVMARDYPGDTLDVYDPGSADPAEGYWEPYWAPSTPFDHKDNHWDQDQVGNDGAAGKIVSKQSKCNDRRTPNLGCPEFNPIVPLTSSKSALIDAAEELEYWCRGGTLGHLGMAWGARVLSPSFLYQGYNGVEISNYDDERWQKVIIMMTDGENQFWGKNTTHNGKDSDFSPYGYYADATHPFGPASPLGNSTNDGRDITQERFLETCDDLKEDGVQIYTIVFGKGSNSSKVKQDFATCASRPENYYLAPDGDDLVDAFETISKELSIIHILN